MTLSAAAVREYGKRLENGFAKMRFPALYEKEKSGIIKPEIHVDTARGRYERINSGRYNAPRDGLRILHWQQRGEMDMSGHKIITIGRQFGSGGREIGQKLAERLELPLYDRRLVTMAAEALGVREEDAERVDESSLNSFVSNYTVSPGMYMEFISATPYIQSFDDEVYRKEAEIIRNLAEKGPCIIVGRCADYVLKDRAECINVFICADKADRIKRIARLYGLTERKAAERIRRTDRERRYYYELHTGQDWGAVSSHQMLFNVSLLGMDKVIDYLEAVYKC